MIAALVHTPSEAFARVSHACASAEVSMAMMNKTRTARHGIEHPFTLVFECMPDRKLLWGWW